jgi:hypothetical protein
MFKGTSFGRLRVLALLLPIMVLTFGQGIAHAATTASGQSSKTVSSSTTFQITGQLNATNLLPPTCDTSVTPTCAPGTNESPCPLQAQDPGNLVCEHFTVTAAVAGSLQACIAFDAGLGLNDVDVFIVDPATGRIVGTPGTSTNNPECASANLAAGQTVEIVINPSFVEGLFLDITGTITFTANPVVVKSGCFQKYGHHEEGAGEDNHHGKFHGEGHRDDKRGEKEGHAQYKNDDEGYNFHSTSADTVEFTQLGTSLLGKPIMQLTMTGTGVNNGQVVTYTIQMVDAGMNGTGDSFLITTSDGKTGGGQATNGRTYYQHYQD